MSVRTWDAGKKQNAILFVFMLFFAVIILMGIASNSNREFLWTPSSVFGMMWVGVLLFGWVVYIWCYRDHGPVHRQNK